MLALGPRGRGVVLAVDRVSRLVLAARRRRGARSGELCGAASIVLRPSRTALTIAVEYFVVRNIDIGRTNTVFKLYLQVWVLWGIAAAGALRAVYEPAARVPRLACASLARRFVLLLAAAALYPLLGAPRQDRRPVRHLGRTHARRNGVHARAGLHDKDVDMPLAYDREAIRWMQEHVDGSPVVAEVNTAPTLYGWESATRCSPAIRRSSAGTTTSASSAARQSDAVPRGSRTSRRLYRTTDAASRSACSRATAPRTSSSAARARLLPGGGRQVGWAGAACWTRRSGTAGMTIYPGRLGAQLGHPGGAGGGEQIAAGTPPTRAQPSGGRRSPADGRRPRTPPRLRGRERHAQELAAATRTAPPSRTRGARRGARRRTAPSAGSGRAGGRSSATRAGS